MSTTTLNTPERLKLETAAAHAALEKTMMRHLRMVNTPFAYASLLQTLGAFLLPLQYSLDAVFDPSLLPDYAKRRKADWLLDDLKALPPAPAVNPVEKPSEIEDIATAFGVLYVLEGSTLGGTIIAGMLRKQTGEPQLPLRYFSSYGADARTYWETFRQALQTFSANHPNSIDRIIAGALETFNSYRRWLQPVPNPA